MDDLNPAGDLVKEVKSHRLGLEKGGCLWVRRSRKVIGVDFVTSRGKILKFLA